jgi:hypothetical protein
MDVNIWAVVAATAAQFVVGMIWYTAVFGKMWGEIHGFNELSKEKQKELASKMGPFYAVQMLVTVLAAWGLAKLIVLLPDYSPYSLAAVLWVAFIVPTQYSSIAFGGTPSQWIVKKFMIEAFGSLACILVGAAVIQAF